MAFVYFVQSTYVSFYLIDNLGIISYGFLLLMHIALPVIGMLLSSLIVSITYKESEQYLINKKSKQCYIPKYLLCVIINLNNKNYLLFFFGK